MVKIVLQDGGADATRSAGAYWTVEEEASLLVRVTHGLDLNDIALVHGRSQYAIEARLS